MPIKVNRAALQLSADNPANAAADVIVLTVHEGVVGATLASGTVASAVCQIMSSADADVDAIASGHTHRAFNWQLPIWQRGSPALIGLPVSLASLFAWNSPITVSPEALPITAGGSRSSPG